MPKQKLTVNLSSEMLEDLRRMAERHGNTVTEELKRAIEDRKFLIDNISDGDEVSVVNPQTPGMKKVLNVRR